MKGGNRTMTTSYLATMLLFAALGLAQQPGANYDEAKVPNYTLPDPLVLQSGAPVRNAETWIKKRRPEILELFRSQVYGLSPGRPAGMTFELASVDKQALAGKAIRKEVLVRFSKDPAGPVVNLLLYLPAAAKNPVPVFLGWNFTGNLTVSRDPGIRLGEVWSRQQKRPATVDSRGSSVSRWPVDLILARGYGVATAYYFDIEPDFDGGIKFGVRPLFFKPGQTAPAADDWAPSAPGPGR
jgi:hypothetical protein